MPDELDGDLLERFVHGDQDAFAALFRQFEVEVYCWILRIVRDASAADEALVEAFWRAYRARARFDPSRSFGAWMRRIATNVALDYLRAARRHAGWSVADDTEMPLGWDRFHALVESLPDEERVVVDCMFVNDLTQVTFFGTIGFPVYAPRTYIGPGYQGTLGSAYATALGAQVGNPDKKVVAIAGDGGFLYTIQELATQRQQGIIVVSIVFNDNAFGNVKRTQQQMFGGRMLGSDLVNPDLVALAAAFGIRATRVESPEGLRGALRSALAAKEPGLIEVTVGEMPSVWPLIIPAGGGYPVML